MAIEKLRYKLEIEFATPLLGSQPQKDVAAEYTQTKAKKAGVDVEDEQQTLPEMLEKGTTAFHKRDGQPVLWDYQIKGFLKEAGATFNGLHGVKNLRSKIGSLVFVYPREIPILVADGGGLDYNERPLRAMTMQGPRVSLARSEQLPEGSRIECEIHVFKSPISEALLRDLLSYGEAQGLGQWRSGGWGRFSFTLTPLQ